MASFAAATPNAGFDPAPGPSGNPWQSVFKDETTLVRLVGGPKHRISLEPSGTTDLRLSGNQPSPDGSRILRLKGVTVGTHVTVVAKDPSATSPLPSDARLEIDVLEPGSRTVRFYRLIDSANHQAKRSLASMRQVVFDASVIHSLQNGVSLNFQGSQDLILSVDLGRIVLSETGFNHLGELFRSGALDLCQADFHVFLVWSVEKDPKNVHAGRQSALAVTRGNLCLFEDFSQPAGPVLAHEVGHYLQQPLVTGDGHHSSPKNMMFEFLPNGMHLNRTQCMIMNTNVRNGSLLPATCQVPLPPDLR